MRRSQISSNGTNDAFERTRGCVLGVRLALCFARDRWRVAQRELYGLPRFYKAKCAVDGGTDCVSIFGLLVSTVGSDPDENTRAQVPLSLAGGV